MRTEWRSYIIIVRTGGGGGGGGGEAVLAIGKQLRLNSVVDPGFGKGESGCACAQ